MACQCHFINSRPRWPGADSSDVQSDFDGFKYDGVSMPFQKGGQVMTPTTYRMISTAANKMPNGPRITLATAHFRPTSSTPPYFFARQRAAPPRAMAGIPQPLQQLSVPIDPVTMAAVAKHLVLS